MNNIIEQSYQLFVDLLFQIKDQQIQEIISYINKHSSSIEEEYKQLYKDYLHYICLYGEDHEVLKAKLKIIKYKYCLVDSNIYYNNQTITITSPYSLSIEDYVKEVMKNLNINEQYHYCICPNSYRQSKHYDYIYELDYFDYIEIYNKNLSIKAYLGDVYDV